jgi:hypothetical protein
LTVALAGCTRGEDTNSEPRTVFLKVTTSEVTTRAEAAGIPDQTQAAFQPGWLFFTNAGGTITRVLRISETATGTPYNEQTNPNEVTVGQLTGAGGQAIENVPGPTTGVHVFSNLPSGWSPWTPLAGQNISMYSEAPLDVEEVYNSSNGDASKVVLYGKGVLAATLNPDEFEAPVTIFPVAGRLEIEKITASAEITSFNVAGVYISEYYPTLAIDGTIGSYLPFSHGPDETKYVANAGGSNYTTAFSGIIFDEGTWSSASQVAQPASSNVWAYNLLAPALGSGQHYFPHVVIKIENIIVANPTINAAYQGKTWFLTIANVYLSTDISTKTPLDFEKSNIYNISNVAFSLSDLGDVPELTTKTVSVEVEVQEWTKNDVLPILQ